MRRKRLKIPADAPWIDIHRSPTCDPTSDAGTALFIAAIVAVAVMLILGS